MAHRIPFVTAQNVGPGPRISMAEAGAPGIEIARAGEMMIRQGSILGEWDKEQKRAERVISLSTAKTEIDTDVDSYLATFEGRTDHAAWKEEYQGKFNEIRATYKEKYTDPEVWRAFEPTLENKLNQARINIDHAGRKMFIQESSAQVDKNYIEKAKRYAYADDPNDQATIKADIELDVRNAQAVGVKSAGQAEEMISKIDKTRDKFRAARLIETNSEVAYATLTKRDQAGQYTEFANIEPEERAALIKEAKHTYDVDRARKEKEETELRENTMIDIYKQLHEKNPNYAGIKRQIEKAATRDPVTGFVALTGSSYHAINTYIDREVRGEGKDAKTDNATYLKIHKQIFAEGGPQVSGEDILADANKGRLSRGDFQELLNKRQAVIKGAERQETAEERAFNETKKRVIAFQDKRIKDIVPGTNDAAKQLQSNISVMMRRAAEGYKTYEDIDKIGDYVDKVVKWSQSGISTSNKVAAEKLIKLIDKPGIEYDRPAATAQKTPAGSATMTESEARAKLTAQGISGAQADGYITQYKKDGLVK